ncbi:nucleotidyltransferase family protein [Paenibacillus sp. FSL H8-0537]|uniref:nucleotidyltransferase domain-containing protein n=1 Tax=Paenibacillus sp. FSL H8-0537 TaxID=2921399 RepID=UPI003100FF91
MDKTYEWEVANLPLELQFILECLRPNADPAVIGRRWAGSRLNGEKIIELARHHRVYPSLYLKLKQLVKPVLPKSVLLTLQQDYYANTLMMLRLSAEMQRIVAALAERGIRSLQLKGPVIAHELYGDISQRTSKDLDILVPIEDVDRAEALLEELGYYDRDPAPRLFNDLKWKTHHSCFEHTINQTQIELHWRLSPDAVKEVSFEQLWAQRRIYEQTGSPIPYLGPEHLFHYLASHGARHGWFRLRWLHDIAQLASACEDGGESLIEETRRNGGAAAIGQALVLARELFGVKLPETLLPLTDSPLVHRLVRCIFPFIQETVTISPIPEEKKMALLYKRYTFMLLTSREKLTHFIGKLYPSAWDAQTLPLPKGLHFLYFPLRPFLYFYRRLKQPRKRVSI